MRIIFVQLIFFTVTNAEYWLHDNTTNYNSLQTPERLKRAPFHRYIPPDTLRATIKDGAKEIQLIWRRVERYLVNKNLPIYMARLNKWGPSHKESNAMTSIGNFITYHDIAQKSAIMYFENVDKIYGVVGRSYDIVNLPIDQLSEPLVPGGPYVYKLPHRIHEKRKLIKTRIVQPPQYDGKKRKMNTGEPDKRNHRDTRLERFYIETLLFVTYDLFQYARDNFNEHYMNRLIIRCILHFNAVDMVFASLPSNDFEIYINLAGIIIEEEDGVFSQITQYQPLKYKSQVLDSSHLFEHFKRYPNHFDFPFERDSFDLMLILTGRKLQFGGIKYSGWHSDAIDIFEERQADSRSYVPIAIVESYNTYSSYCITSHLIGKILEISEYTNSKITMSEMQCYSIMQSSMRHCSECIKWSDESLRQLRIFLSGSRNRCFLLNEPRSLYPPGTPIISLSPCRQCTCFGYTSYAMESLDECPLYIPSGGCGEPLLCRISHKNYEGQSQLETTILPFDGTPCGENKVCWGEKCTSQSRTTTGQIHHKTSQSISKYNLHMLN